jgi:hypothetical protein
VVSAGIRVAVVVATVAAVPGVATAAVAVRNLAGVVSERGPAAAGNSSDAGLRRPGGAVRGDLLGLGFQLINMNGRKCLTVTGGAMGDNAGLIQKACSSDASYRWRFIPVLLTGTFLIQNVKSGKCLTIAGNGTGDNDFAVQYACDNIPARHWQLRNPPGRTAAFPHEDALVVNARSRKCLTIAGGSAAENGVAVQYACDQNLSRRWTVRIVAGPIFDDQATQ